MGWENYPLALPIPQSLVTDFSWCDNPILGSNKVNYAGVNPATISINDGYIIGDSNNGLRVSSDQYYYYFNIMYQNQDAFNGSNWNAPKTNEYGTTTISYISCINRDTGLGIFHIIRKWRDTMDWDASIDPYTGIYANQNKQIAYRFLSGNPFIQHVWFSVPVISGKLGTFNLSTIKNTDINNGDPVSNATSNAFNVLQSATKLSVLAEDKSELTPVIYTDDINYLSLKDLTNNKCELKFYLHNRSFLKITNVSTNAFLSILIDEENKAAKPSIIYKNGSSYSYNQEEPSADTMKHLYEWLMVNEQNIKKKTGLWKTNFTFEKLED